MAKYLLYIYILARLFHMNFLNDFGQIFTPFHRCQEKRDEVGYEYMEGQWKAY